MRYLTLREDCTGSSKPNCVVLHNIFASTGSKRFRNTFGTHPLKEIFLRRKCLHTDSDADRNDICYVTACGMKRLV
jgi:hypothetical protein